MTVEKIQRHGSGETAAAATGQMARFSYEFCCNFGFCFYSTGFLFFYSCIQGHCIIFWFGACMYVQFFFEKKMGEKIQQYVMLISKILFIRRQEKGRIAPKKLCPALLQGDNLSVTYSVECRRMYIVTNFQKQRKPSSCFLQSVKIICTLVVYSFCLCYLVGN